MNHKLIKYYYSACGCVCTYSYTRVRVLVHARVRQRVRNAMCVRIGMRVRDCM